MGAIAKGIPRGCQGLFTPVSLGYPLSVFKKNSTLKGKTEVGTETGEGVKRIPHKYGHISVGLFLTPFPTSPRYVTVSPTKNDLQY